MRLARRLAAGPTLALALLFWAAPARADESDLCLAAAQDAARLSGVPLSVLLAITLTETGRGDGDGGAVRPWPWTINMEGEGHWFATREEALAFAQERHAAGATSFDVGCFQVNWRWHHENFTDIGQMLDPLANASYAAGFLKRLGAEVGAEMGSEMGDWSEAAGAYHSRTPEKATRYRATFDGHREAARAAGADDGRLAGAFAPTDARLAAADPAPGAPRVNDFPLLRATGASPRLGSLVPIDG